MLRPKTDVRKTVEKYMGKLHSDIIDSSISFSVNFNY